MRIRCSLWMLILVLAGSLGLVSVTGAQKTGRADVALEAAAKKELVDGDLKGAIELYRKIIAEYAATDRAAVAKALVRMGQCYEKAGSKEMGEARKAYERVVREFADQQAASEARAHLAAMGAAPTAIGPETRRLWRDTGAAPDSISADGRLLAMVGGTTGDVLLRDLAAGTTRKVTDQGSGALDRGIAYRPVVISADGQLIVHAWLVAPGTLEIRSIRSDGSGMRKHLVRTGVREWLWPRALSPDKRTAILWGRGCHVLSLADNSVSPFGHGEFEIAGISFSPDSRRVVYSRQLDSNRSVKGLFTADADGKNERPLLVEESSSLHPFWSADGKTIVFMSDRMGRMSLWSIPSAGGTPEVLKRDIGRISPLGLGRDGSAFYSTSSVDTDVRVAHIDPATLSMSRDPERLISSYLGRNFGGTFSPDGRWLVWGSHRDPQEKLPPLYSTVARPAEGGAEQVLSVDQGSFLPRWFPDSKAVLLVRLEGYQCVLERVEVPGGQKAELRRVPLDSAGWMRTAAVAPNGEELWCMRCEKPANRKCEIVRYNIAAKTESTISLGEIGAFTYDKPSISPDGKWIAFGANARWNPPRMDLYVVSSDGGTPSRIAQSSEGSSITWNFAWTPDSRRIIYRVDVGSGPSRRGELRVVPREGGEPVSIPLDVTAMSMAPDWRLTYSISSQVYEVWVARGLPGF